MTTIDRQSAEATLRPAVDCRECPYSRTVSGACDHSLNQALVAYLSEGERRTCPVGPDN